MGRVIPARTFFSNDAPAFSRGKAHTIHKSLCFVSFSVIVVSDFQTAFGVRLPICVFAGMIWRLKLREVAVILAQRRLATEMFCP